jgi:hypothetical protein
MSTKKEINENIERCSHFENCNQNFCPLDLELDFRFGRESDKCRFMRNPSKKKVGGKEFISGGRVMPDGILNFVPQRNLKWLNEVSKKRWKEIKK